MQTLTLQEEGACVGTEMPGEQRLPICRTTNLNPPRLTSRRSQPPLALRLQSTPRVGGGSAIFVRRHQRTMKNIVTILTLSLLLTACSRQDAKLSKQIVGTWQSKGAGTLSFKSDASFLFKVRTTTN